MLCNQCCAACAQSIVSAALINSNCDRSSSKTTTTSTLTGTMPIAASQIYARQLLPQKRGYPLFVPEPSERLPDAYRQKGVSIGDVGIIQQDGSFAFAFNACAAADESVNCHGVPAGFKPITINRDRIARFKDMRARGSEVTSSSIKKESLDGLKENK